MNIVNGNVGFFKKRYKRFFVEILTPEGSTILAHCPNNGKMTSLLEENSKVIFKPIDSKLGWQWQMSYIDNTWVGVNTMTPNRIFRECFDDNINELFIKNEKTSILSEYSTKSIHGDNHRVDFLIENCGINIDLVNKHMACNKNIKYNPEYPTLVEVKNVHWKKDLNPIAYFPDCVTSRGTSQVNSLSKIIQGNYNVLICFIIQRSDIDSITIAQEIDPKFYESIKNLIECGGIVIGINCSLEPNSVKYKKIVHFFMD